METCPQEKEPMHGPFQGHQRSSVEEAKIDYASVSGETERLFMTNSCSFEICEQ